MRQIAATRKRDRDREREQDRDRNQNQQRQQEILNLIEHRTEPRTQT